MEVGLTISQTQSTRMALRTLKSHDGPGGFFDDAVEAEGVDRDSQQTGREEQPSVVGSEHNKRGEPEEVPRGEYFPCQDVGQEK